MYINAAYLKGTLIRPRTPRDMEDLETPLRIICCGIYRIHTIPKLTTDRPGGRKDYQLLYFHAGQGHFYFDGPEGEETIVQAGQMVLFCPGEPQLYHYCAGDGTEVFWVHFTGNRVDDLLKHYDFPTSGTVFKSGVYLDYKNLFLLMIKELQLSRASYEEMLSLMLRRIFLLVQRNRQEIENTCTNMQQEIENAILYFNQNYSKSIVIKDYARKHFMSTSWFTRNFKQYTGLTPAQYITSIRIASAQSLLEKQSYSINQIANMVGYEDPLYFTRAFKKQVGCPPREYRKRMLS